MAFGEVDKVTDDEKIIHIAHALNDIQLVSQTLCHGHIGGRAVTLLQAVIRKLSEISYGIRHALLMECRQLNDAKGKRKMTHFCDDCCI